MATEITPATGTALAPRPLLILAIDRMLALDHGDRAALGALRTHLRTLASNEGRCRMLATTEHAVPALAPGVAEALRAYTGRSADDADAWLNAQTQRVAALPR